MKKKLLTPFIPSMVYGLAFVWMLASPQVNAEVIKKAFDFIVGIDGDFKKAIAAARSATPGKRFYIFFPNGEYNIGALTGDSNQMTTFTTSNVSFIGQNTDSTIIFNKSIKEGISITSTLYFSNADNLYLQDLTVLNKANYGDPSTYSITSRHVAIMEQGNNIIYKNVKLLSTQDTYYTKGKRTYWENGEIHGTTDFICGDGDIFFNNCLIYTDKNSTITAPATSTSWGYVFMNCTIDGSVDTYKLGRSWNNKPRCVFINTIMKKIPAAAGWGDPMNVVPALFAEYNSRTASGSPVDLSGRRTTYTKDGTTVTLNPVLTEEQAAIYTIKNVMAGSDNWQPDNLTKQVSAPVVRLDGTTLKWNDNDSALCWMVFKNNNFFKCVTVTSCEIVTSESAKYTIRAANSMGGLGACSNIVTNNGNTGNTQTLSAVKKTGIFLHYTRNKTISVTLPPYVRYVKIDILSISGRVLHSALLDNAHNVMHPEDLATGTYIVRIVINEDGNIKKQTYITQNLILLH